MSLTADEAAAEFKSELDASEGRRLADGVRISLSVDGDRRARAEALAADLGETDVDFVDRNYDFLSATHRARTLSSALPPNYVSAEKLLDPMAPEYGDVEALGKVEKNITSFGVVPARYQRGQDVHATGNMLFSMMLSRADDKAVDAAMAPYRPSLEADLSSGLSFGEIVPGATAELAGLYKGMLPPALAAGGYAGMGAAFGAGPEAAPPAAFVGFKVGAAAEMFKVEAGHAWDEFRQLKFDATGLPIDPDAAAGAAMLVGGINAGLEFLGFSQAFLATWGLPRLVKSLGKQGVRGLLNNPLAREKMARIAQDVMVGTVTEGGTEALQELSVIAAGDLLSGAARTAEEYVRRMAGSAIEGAAGGFGVGLPGAAIRTGSVIAEKRQSQRQMDAIAALGEDVKTSKLYSAAPKRFQEFIRRVQERHGIVDTVYMDNEAAQRYFQNVEPEVMARDMPETAKSFSMALETGDYVAIPLDEFVTFVAPNMGDVAEDITFDVDVPTRREQEKLDQQAAELQDWYEKTQGEIDKAEDPIYGRVYTDLIGAGRRPEIAEKEAMLFTLGIRRHAEVTGQDPLEVIRKISIRGEVMRQEGVDIPSYTGGLLNLLREGRGPSQSDVFGESLIEFLMGLGGIRDEGGELSALDLDKPMPGYPKRRLADRTFIGTLASERGLTWGEAFERARDAGYISGNVGEFAGEEHALMAAIEREARGDRVYSESRISPGAQELQYALDEMERELDAAGIDVQAMTNEQILDVLDISKFSQQVMLDVVDSERLTRAVDMGFDIRTVWYHGAPDTRGILHEGFMSLKERLLGEQDDSRVFFFAKSRRTASTYADDRRAFDYQGAEPGVIPVYLRPGKQLVVDWKGRPYRGTRDRESFNVRETIDDAKARGYDSVLFKNIVDDYYGRGPPDDVVVMFNPDDVRSVDAEFGREGRNIYYQGNDTYDIMEDGPEQIDLFSEFEALGEVDPYEKSETRPGTTEDEKNIGRSALRDLFRQLTVTFRRHWESVEARGGEARLLGARMYKNFIAGKPNQLIGRYIGSTYDLASLAQVYRDPRFETFRFVFVRDGRVVGESAITSRLPGLVRFVDKNKVDIRIAEILKSRFDSLAADGYYMLHNHPSGRVDPSTADRRFTDYVGAQVSGFLGHVIVDHDTYTVLGPNEQIGIRAEGISKVDFTEQQELPHEMIGREIHTSSELAAIGINLQQENDPVVILTGYDGRTTLITSVPMEAVKPSVFRETRVMQLAALRRLARASSAQLAYVVLPKNVSMSTEQASAFVRDFGFAADVLMPNGDVLSNTIPSKFTWSLPIEENARAMYVGEDEGRPYVTDSRVLYQEVGDASEINLKAWAGTDEVIESGDINDFDFSGEGPFVMRVYHGTTHEFSEFNARVRGNIESHFGAVNYFTSSEYDAQQNYLSGGPDITGRIDRLSDDIYFYIDEILQEAGIDGIEQEFGKLSLPQDQLDADYIARHIAERELLGGRDKVLELYVRTQKPFVVGDEKSPWIEFVDFAKIDNEAVERVAGDNGITVEEVEENREEYKDAIDEARWDIEANTGNALWDAVSMVSARYGLDPGLVFAELADEAMDGIRHSRLEDLLRNNKVLMYAEDEDRGALAGSQIIAEIIQELGFDAIILKNADKRFSGMGLDRGVAHVHVFDEHNTNIKSVDNAGTFDRTSPDIYRQENARGYLEVSPTRLVLTLTPKADLSTFLHETGHLFLELLKDAAQQPDASVEVLRDWAIVQRFLGQPGFDIAVEQHEQWARGFERYLGEGRAPTRELAGLFAAFKSWLLNVYRTLRNLNVELDDEIRGVFDRLLVAEAAINRAADDIVPAFAGGQGLTEAEVQKLITLQRLALQAGQEEMEARVRAEVRRMRSQAYRARRDALKETIGQEVDALPVYAVQRLLRTGDDESRTVPPELQGKKLSSRAVIDLFADSKVLRRIPGLATKEGLHPDIFAEVYGFESGYRMLQDIIAAPSRTEAVRTRVQAALDAEFGNMAQDTEVVEQANQAIHNRAMTNFLLAEAKVLNRRMGRKGNTTTLNLAAKEAARRIIRGSQLRRIKPHSYYQAELKAARSSQEAVAAGKFEEAAQAKQQQLLNHHLYREARAAIERADVVRRRLKKYESPTFMKRIRRGDPAKADAIDDLLAGIDLKKTALSKIDAARRLRQYVEAEILQGEIPLIDPALYKQDQLVNYREMTLAQLEALDASVSALAKQGREADKVRVRDRLEDARQTVERLSAVASNNLDRKAIDYRARDNRHPGIRHLSTLAASLRKIEFECRLADGDAAGYWHEVVFRPFVEAQNAKEVAKDAFLARLKDIMGSISVEHARHLNQEISFMGHSMVRGDLYLVVLNMGNQGNMDRLFSRDWKGKEAQALREIQEQLNAADFRRIEALGQLIDSYYEPMAAVSERVDGIRPPKVEARELYLDKYGITLSGWYYPVKYADAPGVPNEAAAVSHGVEMGVSPIHGHVSRSMTKERSESVQGIIDLDWSHLTSHMVQVIHYVTHYEAVKNFDKLRARDDFRVMYEGYFGKEGYEALRSWLQNIATDGTLAQDVLFGSRGAASLAKWARYGMSMLGLSWKVSSAAVQSLGAGPAAKEVGPVRMASWLARLTVGRAGTVGQARVTSDYQRAMEESPELKYLDKQIDRDVREMTDKFLSIMVEPPARRAARWLQANAFFMLIGVQRHINAATWLAAFEKAQEEGRDHRDSVVYADAVVRQTQSGGGLKDLAPIQQNSELTKILTLFYTYFSVQYNQLRLTTKQDLLRGFVKGQGPNGRIVSMQKFVAANLMIVILPSLLEAILKYDEDDDDELLPYLAKRVGSTYLAGIPVARDAYRALTTNYAQPATPLDSMAWSLANGIVGVADVVSGEMNHTDVRNIAKAATLITYLPWYQAVSIYEAVATADGFGEFISHLFFGTPYSEVQEEIL